MAFWVPHKLRWQARLRREWGDRCRREARGFSAELGTTILEGPLPPREVRRRTCGSDRTRSTPYRVGRDAAKTPPALTGDTPSRLRCCVRAFAAVSESGTAGDGRGRTAVFFGVCALPLWSRSFLVFMLSLCGPIWTSLDGPCFYATIGTFRKLCIFE